MQNKFWKFRNLVGGSAELIIYGNIAGEKSWYSDEVTPKEFAEELNSLGAVNELTVRINSGGGDPFAAQTIGNLLEQHAAKTTARIDGCCCSAATIIACHCDKVIAANDSTYMIHPVRMGLDGYADAETLRQCIDAITTIRENIVALYAKKTGRAKEEVAGWMDATSWWTGPQAKEKGFVDELADNGEDTVVENRNGVLFVNRVSMNLPFAETPKFVQDSLAAKDATGQSAITKPAGQPEYTEEVQDMGTEIKTADDLRKAYPALVDQIEQAAKMAAAEAATNAERVRIQNIEDMALPGSENLAAEAKFVNPMSAEDFAKDMVKNAKTQGATYLAQVQKDAENSGINGVTNASPTGSGDAFLDAIRRTGQKK